MKGNIQPLEPLRKARKEQRISLEKLSEELKVGRDTLSAYEKGDSYPNLEVLKRWCTFLDMEIGFIQKI